VCLCFYAGLASSYIIGDRLTSVSASWYLSDDLRVYDERLVRLELRPDFSSA